MSLSTYLRSLLERVIPPSDIVKTKHGEFNMKYENGLVTIVNSNYNNPKKENYCLVKISCLIQPRLLSMLMSMVFPNDNITTRFENGKGNVHYLTSYFSIKVSDLDKFKALVLPYLKSNYFKVEDKTTTVEYGVVDYGSSTLLLKTLSVKEDGGSVKFIEESQLITKQRLLKLIEDKEINIVGYVKQKHINIVEVVKIN